jgi:ribose-phosphate pyrophosphokinase
VKTQFQKQQATMNITQDTTNLTFTSFRFSGGETHFKLTDPIDAEMPVKIDCRVRSGDDVMELLMAVDAIQRAGVLTTNITVALHYLPYARQDRVMVSGEAFCLKVFARLINSLNLGRVEVFDPHSDVGPALIDRCVVIEQTESVAAYVQEHLPKSIVLISPDAGAYKKTAKLAEKLHARVIVATKTRNVTDGKLAPPKVLGEVTGQCCLIVDDICDGGQTFINLADALKAAGATECHLFISHGIFSKGYKDLLSRYQTIGTTDSFKPADEYPANIHVIQLKKFPNQ